MSKPSIVASMNHKLIHYSMIVLLLGLVTPGMARGNDETLLVGAASDKVMHNLITVALEYAPATSRDGLEPYSDRVKHAAKRTSYFIRPRNTDPRISTDLEPHYVALNHAARRKNQLFLFFPGTGGTPSFQQQLCNTAADLGFHVIGLNYPNDEAVSSLCGGAGSDLDCYANVRLEIKDGADRTPLVTVTRANSIENRVIKLLKYLHARFPPDGWGQYLNKNGTIRWASTVVSGHSQGGGHAGIIGRHHLVARVVMFAAMDYNGAAMEPANWIAAPESTPNATPAGRFFGFSHQRDERVNFTTLSTQVWPAYGMDAFGPVVNVDTGTPPYDTTHSLTSNLDAPTGNHHGSVAVDRSLALQADGTPVYKPVWEYLLTIPREAANVSAAGYAAGLQEPKEIFQTHFVPARTSKYGSASLAPVLFEIEGKKHNRQSSNS